MSGRKVWLWSDLHIGHENIIKYENRPFKSIKEMEDFFIEEWKKINKNDIIINNGDFSFKFSKERVQNIIKNLPGYKILILGNHDKSKSVNWWQSVGFNEVYKYPIIFENFYILSHEPVYLNSHMPYVNIHGHLHSKNFESKQYVNISVENTNYKLVNFETIRENLREDDKEIADYD